MKGKERQHNYAKEMQKKAINGFVLVGIDDGFLQGDGCDYVAIKVGIFWLCDTEYGVKEGSDFFSLYSMGCLKVIWQGWRWLCGEEDIGG